MNADEVMHDKLRGRLSAVEGQLEAQVVERAKQAALLDQMDRTIFSLQGAAAVLRDLLAPEAPPAAAEAPAAAAEAEGTQAA